MPRLRSIEADDSASNSAPSQTTLTEALAKYWDDAEPVQVDTAFPLRCGLRDEPSVVGEVVIDTRRLTSLVRQYRSSIVELGAFAEERVDVPELQGMFTDTLNMELMEPFEMDRGWRYADA